QYKQDIARCNAGQTNQDKATCKREAGAAYEEARHHRLTNDQAGSFKQNATMRCNALPTNQQQDCLTQMSDQNTTTKGSVGAGGILRETTITVPATVSNTNTYTTPSTTTTQPMTGNGLR